MTDQLNVIAQESGEGWILYNGDSCEVLQGIPEKSIGLSVYSPPFSNLYIYSDSMNDMGNSKDFDEFFGHYNYMIGELLRVTIPGRLSVVHCKDLPAYANRDDYAGLIDFPGMIVRAYEDAGWRFHSRVTIWKCPVTERERTNNNGLLHKTAERDRSCLRQGMADYLLVFRRWPDNGTLTSDQPVTYGDGTAFRRYIGEVHPNDQANHPSKFCRKDKSKRGNGGSIDIWRRYAEPVWWDISQTDVLNYKLGRDESDERHICPLQLGLIERCIDLWSNPGDTVLTPFAGIGSEVYQAVAQGRKGIGIELKPSYFNVAIKNCRVAEAKANEGKLF